MVMHREAGQLFKPCAAANKYGVIILYALFCGIANKEVGGMTEEIVKLAANQGLWAVLAVVLLFYVLKQNEKRETGYQTTIRENQTIIGKLSDTINLKITGLECDIKEIKEDLKC